jgi:signal peptidase I
MAHWSGLSAPSAGVIIESVSEPRLVDPAASERQTSGLANSLVELLQTALIAGLLFLAVNLVTARIRVEGSSMEPSLHDGEMVVVNRLAYRWSTPARGDIIVFRFPLDPSRRFIKRIIGLPGDVVQARAGKIYINGAPLDEPYIAAAPRYSGEWVVAASDLFVLGDNRNNSSDSQNWGLLPTADVIGKAIVVYWPPNDVGLIPHYSLAASAKN